MAVYPELSPGQRSGAVPGEKMLTAYFESAAGAASDIDVPVTGVLSKPIFVTSVSVVYYLLGGTRTNGCDLNLQADDGTTETEIAYHDTAAS